VSITELLRQETVRTPLRSRKKKEALDEMAELLMASGRAKDEKSLRKALAAREKMGTTSVGNGVAIPHGKCDETEGMCVAVGIAPDGIDWDAPDGKPVRILVALSGPPNKPVDHLRLLSQVARLLGREAVREQMIQASSSSEILEVLAGAVGEAPPKPAPTEEESDKLVIIHLKEEEYLDSILEYLIELGVEGPTVIEGQPADQVVSTHVPLFADFLLAGQKSPVTKVILCFTPGHMIRHLIEGVLGLLRGTDRKEALKMFAVEAKLLCCPDATTEEP
jgi:mannitol/fructose-specific phosphotransferase system IIA component (Ntr-type)